MNLNHQLATSYTKKNFRKTQISLSVLVTLKYARNIHMHTYTQTN